MKNTIAFLLIILMLAGSASGAYSAEGSKVLVSRDNVTYISQNGSLSKYTGWATSGDNYRYYNNGKLITTKRWINGIERRFDKNGNLLSQAQIAELKSQPSGGIGAANAFDRFFTTTKNGHTAYPDDFAGIWVESDGVVVALTSDENSVISKYNNVLRKYGPVRYVYQQYPYSEMLALQEKLTNLFDKTGNFSASYVDVMSNQLIIMVNGITVEEAASRFNDSDPSRIVIEIGNVEDDV